jgi:hypothetical protein
VARYLGRYQGFASYFFATCFTRAMAPRLAILGCPSPVEATRPHLSCFVSQRLFHLTLSIAPGESSALIIELLALGQP